jgi:hypothetical protein
MFQQSVSSSLMVASLASKFLKENGLLTLAGAAAALEPTPGALKRQLSEALHTQPRWHSSRNDRLWRSESRHHSYWPKFSRSE